MVCQYLGGCRLSEVRCLGFRRTSSEKASSKRDFSFKKQLIIEIQRVVILELNVGVCGIK